jgi:hypothetical protein
MLPILAMFCRRKVFDALIRGIDVRELQKETAARRGYLNIALRALASAGWLQGFSAPSRPADLEAPLAVRLTPVGRRAAELLGGLGTRLDRVEASLALSQVMPRYLWSEELAPEGVASLPEMAQWCRSRCGLPTASGRNDGPVVDRLAAMLEGPLAAPLAVFLARDELVQTRGSGRNAEVDDRVVFPSSFGPSSRRRFEQEVFPCLVALGWMNPRTERLTNDGRLAVLYGSAYAVTLSYLPLLRRVEELTFRNTSFERLFPTDAAGHETHVDRRLNIWGSGGAHALYFSAVDRIVLELFRRPDYPRAICDTGCGDGTFLRHLATLLRDELGWDFFTRPVAFIGSDLNLASRQRTREALAAEGIPHAYVIDEAIDIAAPDRLDAAIRQLDLFIEGDDGTSRLLAAADALHTNSMLVHNRTYQPSLRPPPSSTTDGCFVDPSGHALVGTALQANLVDFISRWRPFVQRYGWLFIELHTLPSSVVAQDPDRTPTIAYDLTHGFSNQYTVELTELITAAQTAGLELGPPQFQAHFPSAELPRISVTYLRGAGRSD